MKRTFYIFCFIYTISSLSAQSILSETTKASVKNRLGFSTVEVSYSRPLVNEREIWDGLVPFGEVWRTGADYPTFITFSDTVIVQGNTVNPGKYALYTIPEKDEWTIILSGDLELWGAFGYKHENDVLRIKTKSEPAEFEESFLIYFSETRSNSCKLVLHWEKVKVKINLTVDEHEEVKERVQRLIDTGKADWGVYWRGANYMLANKINKTLALQWITASIELEENWMNMDTYAKVLDWNGNRKDAIQAAKKSLQYCMDQKEYCPYTTAYQTQLRKLKEE